MNDDSLVPFFVTVTLLMVVFAFFLIITLIVQKNKQNRQANELLQAQVKERDRTMSLISVEIHDNISQMLSLTRMTLRMIGKQAVPEQMPLLEQAGSMLDNLIVDTRNISHSLNTDYLKNKGLLEFMNREVKWINASKGIVCNLEATGYHDQLSGEKELMVIRIAQEAIQNTIKHSEATHLHIGITCSEKLFKIIITDNGKGFSHTPGTDASSGLGLQSMYQRAELIKAKLNIQSGSNGTTLTLAVPQEQKEKVLTEQKNSPLL
ncbi:sensor histidine kinase [Taibaiella koreensis]|uniref:sensor histidine kinase n=1 Tax=Taibaiella koreensis TaxID=1268548 RepID=UPI000E5A040F|nr:ATP-binding protein [Taibaiella koreensis]